MLVKSEFLQLINVRGFSSLRPTFLGAGLYSGFHAEVSLPGAESLAILAARAPAQLTTRCARAPFPAWTVRTAEATYREYRAAFVARFDTDLSQAAPAGSPFAATSCEGARMTRVQGESRFPVGSGLNTIDVSAQVSATVATRRCAPSASGAGASCTEWSEAPCTESWCAALASARSVTFRQQEDGVALDLPRLSVAVPAQVVVSTPAQGSIGTNTNAVVTNSCFRIPFFRPWSGDPATAWTEERGVVIARY